MRYIKLFESNLSNARLSVEDITDYFLEFIDNESMKLTNTKIDKIYTISPPSYKIVTSLSISKKFRILRNDTIIDFCKILESIKSICNRWNLNFDLKLGDVDNNLSLHIYQNLPEIVHSYLLEDNISPHMAITSSKFKINLNNLNIRFGQILKLNNDNNFEIWLNIEKYRGGSGKNGSWIKSDNDELNKNRNLIPILLEKEVNKKFPCNFIGEEHSNNNTWFKFKINA